MFTKYMRSVSGQDCPVVLSITEVPQATPIEPAIQRNEVRRRSVEEPSRIYEHAREIYFRARRQRPVRAASIF